MKSSITPRLLAFVRSRLPMVEHDFAPFEGESSSHADQRVGAGTYSISQAFFYAADLWVDKPPLVSVKALEYAKHRWGDQASKVWTLKRAEIPQVDGCKVSQSGLIYEHVTTGGMFREYLRQMLATRAGVLDAFAVASWLHENFQTAWVTRDEDRALTSRGHKSRRGASMDEALSVYKNCGIEISPRPDGSPDLVRVGDAVLVDEVLADEIVVGEADNAQEVHKLPGPGGNYARFFAGVAEALRERKSRVSIRHGRDDRYATVRGFALPGTSAVLQVDAPKGGTVRTPVLSLEAVTANPGVEPTTDSWASLRDTFFVPEWRISYGSHGGVTNALCRCKRSLAVAFEIADANARGEAAKQTAEQIDALWAALHV